MCELPSLVPGALPPTIHTKTKRTRQSPKPVTCDTKACWFKQASNRRQGGIDALILYLEPCEVYNGLDKDGVITYVGVLRVQLGKGTEERAAAGDVHIADGPLEGGGRDVGPEGINDVLPVVLVQQHEGDLGTDGRALYLLWSSHMSASH